MIIKIMGSCLIIFACGAYGFIFASKYSNDVKCLQNLLTVLRTVECELEYRMTPLPDLCFIASESVPGSLSHLFKQLGNELNEQISPDVERCMHKALTTISLPERTCQMLEKMGKSLGKFDINGQLKGIRALYEEVQQKLKTLTTNQDVRLRSYRTLGMCAGIVIVILLI